MMSVSTCTAAMASSYYEKDDRNYYVAGEQEDIKAKWRGSGLQAEGLQEGQEVSPQDFTSLLGSSGRGCAAYDCTFSAPKGVSILAEAGDEQQRADMIAAHRAAVARTIEDMIRNEVGYVTRKDGVDTWIRTGDAVAADFVHGVSRSGDPQLHDHVVFLNRTHDADGQQRTIDGRHFFAVQKSYGGTYRGYLDEEIRKRGYETEITDEKQGFIDVKGLDAETLEHFSKRRAEILAEMEKNGETGAKAAQKANLATRKTKKQIHQEQARESWRRELQEIGQELPKSTGKPVAAHGTKEEAYAAAVHDLEQSSFAFTSKQLTEAITARGVSCGGVSVTEARQMIAADPSLLVGELADNKTRATWITTKKNLAVDKAIEESYLTARGSLQNSISSEQARELLETVEMGQESTLKDEQRNAAAAVLSSQSSQMCIQGLAGVGKTFTVSRIREAAEEWNKTAPASEQIHFVGLAPSGKAAAGLLEESGITEGGTIHSYLNELTGYKPQAGEPIRSEWDFSKCPPAVGREIVIVDEAGMLDNNLIHQLQKMQVARSGKGGQVQLVFQGDYDQLPPVGAAQPFRHMTDLDAADKSGNTVFLEDIQRQKVQELLEGVRASVKGDHLVLFENLDKMGDYREVKGDAHRRKAAVREIMDGVKISDYGENMLIVGTNKDRKIYNDMIRSEYIKRGEMQQGNEYEITVNDGEQQRKEKRNFAKGERMIFLANSKKLGVMNGQTGSIIDIQGDMFTVEKDDGQRVSFDMKKYNQIDQAWALVNYKAQGASVNGKVICDMSTKSKQQFRNDLYVDASRAKRRCVIFTDDKAKLETQTRKWAHKIQRGDFEKFSSKSPATKSKNGKRRGVQVVTKTAKKTMQAAGKVMEFGAAVMRGAGQLASVIPIVGKPLQAAIDIPAAAMDGTGKMIGTFGKSMSALDRAEALSREFGKTFLNIGKKTFEAGKQTAKATKDAAEKIDKTTKEPQPTSNSSGVKLPDTNKWDYTHGGKLESPLAKAERENKQFLKETLDNDFEI